jgi:hypothetical protein
MRLTFYLTGGLLLLGLLFGISMDSAAIGDPSAGWPNAYYYLYAKNEPAVLLILLIACVLCHRYFHMPKPADAGGNFLSGLLFQRLQNSRGIPALCFGVFTAAAAGTFFILHNHGLSMDEFSADFQAAIFARGQLWSVLPEEWQSFGDALTPVFIAHDPVRHSWISTYLPSYALLRSLFFRLEMESLLNPLLAAGSVWMITRVARQLWPSEKTAPVLAAVLLATSAQFWLTSMTAYSTPAHLFLNLCWLHFYLNKDRWSWLLVPWIGVFAVELHKPNVHALFAIPFLIRFLRNRQWGFCLYYGAVYLFSVYLTKLWWTLSMPNVVSHLASGGSPTALMEWPGLVDLIFRVATLPLLFSWQSLAGIFLCWLALGRYRQLPPVLRDLAWGCALLWLFYFLGRANQIHGWGYRYCYAVLGNMVLLAVAGWFYLEKEVGTPRAREFLLASCMLALFVQLPIRCYQASSFTGMFAHATAYVRALPADFVVIDKYKNWFCQDLVRNDPFLENTPKFFFLHKLKPGQLEELKRKGSVHIVQPEELAIFGLEKTASPRNVPAVTSPSAALPSAPR